MTVEDCEVVDNLDDGLFAVAGGTLVVERTVIARNADNGVFLGGAAPGSRVEDCEIESNAGFGVMVTESRGLRILRNRVRRNGVGIAVAGASPVVEGNDLADNGVGIGVRGEGSDPIVRANTISGGRGAGVIVDEAAAG